MLAYSLILAEIASLLDPDWWVKNLGPLGVVLLMGYLVSRQYGPAILRLIHSAADDIDEQKKQFPVLSERVGGIEQQLGPMGRDIMEIKSATVPGGK